MVMALRFNTVAAAALLDIHTAENGGGHDRSGLLEIRWRCQPMTETKQHRNVAIALQKLRKALYRNHDDLAVSDVVDAIEEYVTARLAAAEKAVMARE